MLLPSSPCLADEAAGQLHFAPPKVDAHGPHVLLLELFLGQRFSLQEQSPTYNTIKASIAYITTCNTIKASIAYITMYYVSKTQSTPQSPFLTLQTHIFCLHLSPFAQTWNW